ncbi:MAG: ketoacyl-ACP synthase III [Thermoguttaceae bacterium]|nr:ketoacyl-ACP synthase III [Planctomycetaceae bacterium]MBQ4144090.1 ketoacyl-ACP synthase III [Thermoguttaceae bacterium]
MNYATIGPISVYLPERCETIDDLKKEHPEWELDEICAKTGVYARYISAPDEFASDMAVKAAAQLLEEYQIPRESIDFVILCTQSPDYPIPTTACLVQHRLGLRIDCGALDFNLGCSGYVYGLSLADGLIRTGVAKRVLFITSETYTKYIDSGDRSLRTIFGDAATATLLEAGESQSLGPFLFGTDGEGADALIAYGRGIRPESLSLKPRHRRRWASSLYMDGAELMRFTNSKIPPLVAQLLEKANMQLEDIDIFLMHQATRKMLESLTVTMGLSPEKVPIQLERYGNTVSSSIPILIANLRKEGGLRHNQRAMLLGFGVGLSWGGVLWNDVWNPNR